MQIFSHASKLAIVLTVPALFSMGCTQETQNQIDQAKDKDPNQREVILDLIQTFCEGLSNQELGTMYLLLSEIEKDKSTLKTILELITQNTTTTQS